MSNNDVAIIDYGMGNLLSVKRALEYCGAKVTITSDPVTIISASRVVLPGVGAYAHGMHGLSRTGLDLVVKNIASRGTPILGICLGMQLLLDESDEFGKTTGLGLIPGRVISLPTTDINGQKLKIPHIGWNSLQLTCCYENQIKPFLANWKSNDTYYFVHSFMSVTKYREHQIATCTFGGHQVPAVIKSGNIIGCQFHPEKSGEAGLKILRRFIAE